MGGEEKERGGNWQMLLSGLFGPDSIVCVNCSSLLSISRKDKERDKKEE